MYRPIYVPEASALVFAADSFRKGLGWFSATINVFVCGALQDPEKMRSLLGLAPAFAPAAVTGYRRSEETIDGKTIPLMIPASDTPAQILTGVVWLHLSEADLGRIEEIELAGGHRRAAGLKVCIGQLQVAATTYIKADPCRGPKPA
ncbi:MAG: gamma-glutamylcyclotransferase [Desulfobacterales bacterium]|nr:gamma-glutamylcyclotransferase [Desulfobacterales bacterium]